MFFKQIKQYSDNFSYIVADQDVKEAAVIDSSYNVSEIMRVLKNENMRLKFVFNTHGHSDHIAGDGELQSKFGAQVVAHKLSAVASDIRVDDGDVVKVGGVSIQVIYTPGHTKDGVCLLVDNKKLLTGDTLFVGECGRSDLAGGNSKSLYFSLFNRLLKLDGSLEVYPGHDYGSKPFSTIEEEKKSNYTLQPRSLDEFVEFMSQP